MSRQANLKRIFMNNNYFSQKGQALVELAVLGTILLFCLGMLVNFGLQANYQQEMEMKAFRLAMQQSYNSAKGPSAGGGVNLIEDKPGVATQDPYATNERYAFVSAGSVNWNNNLMDDYVDANNNLQNGSGGRPDYRPTMSYNINGKESESYTTAGFEPYVCGYNTPDNSITIRVADNRDEYNMDGTLGKDGIYWKKIKVNCNETKIDCEKIENDKCKDNAFIGYVMINGEKEQIGSADVDNDGKDESVVKVEPGKNSHGEDVLYGPVQTFWVLDYQKGRIDTSIEMTHKADGTDDVAEYAKKRQGLLPDYTKTITKTGVMQKKEDKSGITTTTDAFSNEIITRKVKLNDGGKPVDITSELPYGRSAAWTTPK